MKLMEHNPNVELKDNQGRLGSSQVVITLLPPGPLNLELSAHF